MDYLLTFVGGGLGSMTRLAVATVFSRWVGTAWAYGTLFINVTGSFVIGLFLTLAGERLGFSAPWRFFVATGFLGGYTTFSTFEYETQRLVELGAPVYAAAYVGSSVVLGFGAAFVGVGSERGESANGRTAVASGGAATIIIVPRGRSILRYRLSSCGAETVSMKKSSLSPSSGFGSRAGRSRGRAVCRRRVPPRRRCSPSWWLQAGGSQRQELNIWRHPQVRK